MLTGAGCLAVLLCLGCAATDLAAAPRLAAGDASNREVGSFAAPARSTEVNVQVIPAPSRVTAGQGTFTVTERTPIVAAGGESERIGRYLADLIARTRGIHLPVQAAVAGAPRAGRIELQIDPSIDTESAEAYTMDVSPLGVLIRAREARGLFYGAITFWSLVTGAPEAGKSAQATIDAVRIADAPRFAWRGFMLDSARHYQPPAFIKDMLDWMALHKLNTFHWHLTDDQAWRLQIKKYPRLTEVGAWRVPAGAGAAADIDPATGKPRLYGGYYTQDQVREIVAYAADRFITVVPEIEMPGHAQAALAAYPELGTDAAAPPVSSDWGVHTYLYNPDDATFAFLEDVLTEVMALFPGQYIHVGGDEAVKDRWRASPAVQERMRALGVANEAALQAYFTHRIESFLSAHGRKLIGWDEILEGSLPPTATVMSWRGTAGAIEASKQGHDVVMAPAPTLYLDYLQSDLPDEPSGRPTYVTLRDMYAFNPLPAEIQGDAARHVLGAQINAWTEHMRTTERVEHAAFPRMAAFAEVVWTAPANAADRWPSFVTRLPAQFARYQKLGIHYADSVFAVKFAVAERAELSNQINIGEIRYTLDGSMPTRKSKLYTSPITFKRPTTVTAATFLDGKRVSEPRSRKFDRMSALRRMDTELKSCANKLVLRLEDDAPINGTRAMFTVDILDPCWIWEKADLARVTGIAADVGQVPFNFQVGDAVKQIPLLPPQTPEGELEVRQDSCDGPRIAVLPLAPAASNAAVTALPRVPLSREAQGGGSDVHDLCLRFTRRSVDPIWTLQSVQLFE
ncbi:MAG TPA: family 20 glycosylhydrolase [Steroidobacteraceae bacterium]|jgi:hexosaminidase|nr:family 20 glycosylhydrolase [Steroidobacteraceae bacterium]